MKEMILKILTWIFTKKEKYIKYKVYCERQGGSYNPDYGEPMYEYQTPYLYVAEEDLSAYKIVGIDKKGNETIIYEL